eukprot:TRINITY_DN32165_c0_g1_i1.p1 TRINITY_DN32165_c0_g1~~TRINITY_DN32165_c0_g1_i1.p1  ORF type:complete len:752 (+),score=79.02 TRINITY_DN32165_c0_g1_i1:192-2447(+)
MASLDEARKYYALGVVLFVWILLALATDCKDLVRTVRAYAKHLATWFQKASKVDDKLLEMRSRFVVSINDRILVVLLLSTLAFVPNMFREAQGRLMLRQQEPVFASALAATALLRVTLHRFTGFQSRRLKFLDLSYAYFSFAMGLCISFVLRCDRDNLYASVILTLYFRILLTLMPLDKRYVLLGNVAFDAATAWQIQKFRSEQGGTGYLQGAIHAHLLVTLLMVNSPLFAGSIFFAEVKADTTAATMRIACRGLLDHLCDAVLDLDLELRISAECSRLSSMLLKSGNNSLEGAKLSDWMPEASARRFGDVLQGAGGSAAPEVGTLDVAFKDLLGKVLRVEAFYIRLAWESRYLVGLRKLPGEGDEATTKATPLLAGETGGASSFHTLAEQPLPPELDVVVQMAQPAAAPSVHVAQPVAPVPVQPVHSFEPLQPLAWAPMIGRAGSVASMSSAHSVDSGSSSGCSDYSRSTRRSRKRPSSVSSSVRSTLKRASRFEVPSRLATTNDTKQAMVTWLLKSVHFKKPEGCEINECCKRHNALRELLKLVVRMQNDVCAAGFSHYTAWQCDSCGVLRNNAPGARGCKICLLRQRCGPGVEILGRASALEDQPSGLNGSGDDASARPGGELAIPGRELTSVEVRLAMVEDVLRSWNSIQGRARRRCCARHSALNQLFSLISPMQHDQCDPSFDYYTEWQCVSCGILDSAVPEAGDRCFCRQMDRFDRPDRPEAIAAFGARVPQAPIRPEGVVTKIL